MNMVAHRVSQILRIALKEWRLLLRNPHGLAVLFLMPAIFVLIMSVTMKNTLVAPISMPLTGWVLEDSSQAANKWMSDWHQHHRGELYPSREALQQALKDRKIEAGVVVLKGWLTTDGRPDIKQTEIWLDHRIQPAAAGKLRAEIAFSTLIAHIKITAAREGTFTSILLNSGQNFERNDENNIPSIHYLYEIESGRKINAVQQSVPAWLIFGMFFVVIPIAGVLIQERRDGTLTRLETFGVTHVAILGGKFIAFLIMNWIQLVFMLAVGCWIVPLFAGEALDLNLSLFWFFGIVLATSMAAISLALLVAAFTRNFDHAAALGSGLNVVLAAIAGIMVPRMLMPAKLQMISEWSPMGWALDGMQTVFLGAPDSSFMMPRIALLFTFSFVCLVLSWWKLRAK
jgi:ABC-2 type transport system permease protein